MTPLEAAWEHYGGTLQGTHGRIKARCPLHDDKNASASVNIEEQRWTCFAGCGFGDIYELVQIADGFTSFPEAKAFADERFGTVKQVGKPTSTKTKRGRRKSWV